MDKCPFYRPRGKFTTWSSLKRVAIEMGRTVPAFRQVLHAEIKRWEKYRRALRLDERKVFDRMMDNCLRHASASGQAGRSVPTELMFMSILLEQQKEIDRLKVEPKRLGEEPVTERVIDR